MTCFCLPSADGSRKMGFMHRCRHGFGGEPLAQPPPWAPRDAPPPAQPGDETWTFIDDLKAPLWGDGLGWCPRAVRPGEADLSGGVRIEARFPDPDGHLATAYADLADFLAAVGVSRSGSAVIETAWAAMPVFEAYRIEVAPGVCRILAADTEGIRRGIFAVEAMMREAEGPFLPLGRRERRPFIRSRISRCFFGPIKRPPRYRDELMDDVDYYPDAYLNRLAHEGINGLWLTIAFQDLCAPSLAPPPAHRRREPRRSWLALLRSPRPRARVPAGQRSDVMGTSPGPVAVGVVRATCSGTLKVGR